MHVAPSLPKPKQYTSIWFGRRFEGADGTDCVSGIAVSADRQELVALMASMPTMWRVLDRMRRTRRGPDRAGLTHRAGSAWAWAAGARPDLSGELVIYLDATITTAHREGERGPDVAGDVWG